MQETPQYATRKASQSIEIFGLFYARWGEVLAKLHRGMVLIIS
jgi:hypothetical protein